MAARDRSSESGRRPAYTSSVIAALACPRTPPDAGSKLRASGLAQAAESGALGDVAGIVEAEMSAALEALVRIGG